MRITKVEIHGVAGPVEIAATDEGALVTAGNRVVCAVRRDEDRESRYAKARDAATAICGAARGGGPNATNSMVHDVLDEIERIAGC